MNVKVLIDISDDRYKQILKSNSINHYLEAAVRNGTPLPKNYGRLVDADVLAEGFEDNYEFCEVLNATPTIIEADKKAERTLLDVVADWNKAIEKNGYIN